MSFYLQFKGLPSFILYVDNPEQYYLPLPGADPNEAKFYYIPVNVEPVAGEKRRRLHAKK